jgi:hypothetical protein
MVADLEQSNVSCLEQLENLIIGSFRPATCLSVFLRLLSGQG